MTRCAGLAVLLVLPLLSNAAQAQEAAADGQGERLAGVAPLGLTGVQALWVRVGHDDG